MLNLLIANRNLQNLQNLQNYISLYIPDIRVGYITQDGKDVLNILNQYHFDIAIIDEKLPNYDGFDILEKLSSIKQIEYNNSIIFLSHNQNIITNLKKHNLVFDAFLDTESFSPIISSLKKLVENKKNQADISYTRNKIFNELQAIGYNLAHNGTHYIAESLTLISAFKYDSENLSKSVYPEVSKIYNKSLHNIKCNITSATDAACRNLTKTILKNYLKLSEDIKPTSKMIINSVLQKI